MLFLIISNNIRPALIWLFILVPISDCLAVSPAEYSANKQTEEVAITANPRLAKANPAVSFSDEQSWLPFAAFGEQGTYIAAAAVVLITIFIFWNRRLSHEINLRVETERRLNEAQRLAKIGSWEFDLIRNELIWSDETYQITEIDKTRVDISYEVFLEAIHPEDRDMLDKAYHDSLKSHLPYEITHRLLMADGRIKYVNESCETFFDNEGNPVRSLGTVQDVTELKKKEQEVELMASIVKHSQDFIGIADIEGNALFINEAGSNLVGISDIEHLLKTNMMDYFSDEAREVLVNEILPTVKAKGRWAGESHFQHFTSRENIPVWFDVFRIDHPVTGKPLNYATITRDIRQQKAIEFELNKHRDHLEELVHERTKDIKIARDEAQRANQAKSEFLSRMSHELRTPMNAILGFGQVLKMGRDKLTTMQDDNVKEILRAGYHLLDLINDVLDLSKVESGKLDVLMTTVSVDEILLECTAMIQNDVKTHHLSLIDHISGRGFQVKADHTRLKQVLVNLLSNAVKYNSEHGHILLDAKCIDKQRLRINITDAGNGLSEEDIGKLFTPFERMASTRNVEGTGIGLVISKHLIEAMSGAIGIESQSGVGSTFWIELELYEDS